MTANKSSSSADAGAPAFSHPLTLRIVAFLNEIGLRARPGAVAPGAVLPGVAVEHGGLVIDERSLAYPGDILHEAGHLAVAPPERRAAMHIDVGDDGGEEMMAIAWSYAAALHLGVDPAVVFHDGGYRGGGDSLLENFQAGRYFAVSTLQWAGMTMDAARASQEGGLAYPHMRRWLRADAEEGSSRQSVKFARAI